MKTPTNYKSLSACLGKAILLPLILIILFLSPTIGQDYIINRGNFSGWYTGGLRLCVVDKNEFYQSYTSASKVVVRQYKNGIVSDWGTNAAFVNAAGAGDIVRDSANQTIYISFVNSTNDKIYTYKRALADIDWVLVSTLDKPSSNLMGWQLRLAFNKKSGTLFLSFIEQTTNKIYLYELIAGTWTNRTGASSMSCYNSGFDMVAYDNKVILTTAPLIGAYYTLRVHAWDILSTSFTNLPDWNSGLSYQSVQFPTTAYNSVADEYVSMVSSSYTPKVIKYAGGSWADMSTGLSGSVDNGSWGSYIVYNNMTAKYSLFYSSTSIKGYYWNGSTWSNMSVPYMGSTNLFATTNYKDVYFLAWSGYTQVGVYSSNETPFRNTLNIATTPSTTSCALTFSERGVGNKVAVFIKSGTYESPVTADGATYTANPIYGSGTQLGSSGWYCIYNDVGQAFTVTGLTNGNTYQVQAIEYNGVAGAEMYIGASAVTGNPVSFTAGVVLPVNFINVSAYRKTNTVQVNWKVDNEINIHHYEVESSLDGRSFAKAGTAAVTGLTDYSIVDANAANTTLFYRVKSVGISSEIKYSAIVKLAADNARKTYTVAPNPVEGNELNIQFKNQPAGLYNIKLMNSTGQQVKSMEINHMGGNATQTIALPTGLTSGTYLLQIISTSKTTELESILIYKK